LTVDYTSDISNNFFYTISGDFLIPKNNPTTATGPFSFNSANTGISIGARLGRFDITTGVQGGVLWNMRIRPGAQNPDGWIRPEQPASNFNGSITAGLQYNILPYLGINAAVSKNFYQYSSINPDQSTTATPAFNEADLSSYSAHLGLSFGVPWEATPQKREPTYRRGAPVIEDRRLSLNYEMRGYAYSYQLNNNYDGSVNMFKKGFLRAEYKQYLSNHFFLSSSAGYLIPSSGGNFFSSGPINFQTANLDLLAGVRWGKVSLFTGLEGGLLWNIRIKSQTPSQQEVAWKAPEDIKSSFNGTFKAGMEYHIFEYLSLKAQFFYNTFQHNELEPDFQNPEIPSINSAEFAPFSAGIGVSVSLPWKSGHNRGAPPPRTRPQPPAISQSTPDTNTGEETDNTEQTTEEESEPELPPVVERPPDSTPAQLSFTNPIPARDIMTSPFGDDRGHEGLDINANTGDPILSVAKGEVIEAGWASGYGRQVKVEHPGGFVSVYAHLSEISVEPGQQVDRGTQLGEAGNSGFSSGPHLHFELLRMEMPINPRRYIIYDWEDWNP
jgi:murein DD-endopeptidase MepM/ murein hydrolase activator NlpD